VKNSNEPTGGMVTLLRDHASGKARVLRFHDIVFIGPAGFKV
jgi:hypothetical protein